MNTTIAVRELIRQYNEIHKKLKNTKSKIRQPTDIIPHCLDISQKKQEHFLVIALDGNHNVISKKVITKGLVNFCQVHPREVFKFAIARNAVSIILVHNHPSGNLEPSQADLDITTRLIRAGELLGIKVLDHIIVGSLGGHNSLNESTGIFY